MPVATMPPACCLRREGTAQTGNLPSMRKQSVRKNKGFRVVWFMAGNLAGHGLLIANDRCQPFVSLNMVKYGFYNGILHSWIDLCIATVS